MLYKEKSLAKIVVKVFDELYEVDKFASFFKFKNESKPNGGRPNDLIVQLKDDTNSLTGLFLISDLAEAKRRNLVRSPRWFEKFYTISGQDYFLSTQWNKSGSFQLTCDDLIHFVKICYPNYTLAYDSGGSYIFSDSEDLPTETLKNRGSAAVEVDISNLSKKDQAKKIIDAVYEYDDSLKALSCCTLFEKIGKSISVSSEEIALFVDPDKTETDYVFPDEYRILVNGIRKVCKLYSVWYSPGITTVGKAESKRNIPNLINIVNKYYPGAFAISNKTEPVERGLLLAKLQETFFSKLDDRYAQALLSKPFTILTGNSGTGKTRIAKNFAQWMSVDGLDNVLLLPVGADWTDNTKIFGYYNPLTNDGSGEYIKTNVLRLVERANAHPDVPFFLILDEMNLSHVERYFSDFLSLMETPDESIKLNGYGSELKFPKNLFVTGTVNIDETTYMFSPKVLDRANVIEFKPEMDDVLGSLMQSSKGNGIVPADSGYAEAFMKLANEVREDKIHADLKLDDIKVHLDALYQILQDSGFEFAYRTVKEIRLYAIAAYELCEDKSEYNVKQVADEQIVQKILPKIHGNKKQIGEMLKKLFDYCSNQNFNLSSKKIAEMQKRLERFQYASFV